VKIDNKELPYDLKPTLMIAKARRPKVGKRLLLPAAVLPRFMTVAWM
jgi:hypothetical protein